MFPVNFISGVSHLKTNTAVHLSTERLDVQIKQTRIII